MFCAGTEAIDQPGVAETQGPVDLWAGGNPGPVLSEVDRTGDTSELHTTSPDASLSLGVSEVWWAWLGAWNLFFKGCRTMGLELRLWFSFLLCLELAVDSGQA